MRELGRRDIRRYDAKLRDLGITFRNKSVAKQFRPIKTQNFEKLCVLAAKLRRPSSRMRASS